MFLSHLFLHLHLEISYWIITCYCIGCIISMAPRGYTVVTVANLEER